MDFPRMRSSSFGAKKEGSKESSGSHERGEQTKKWKFIFGHNFLVRIIGGVGVFDTEHKASLINTSHVMVENQKSQEMDSHYCGFSLL